MLLKKRQRTIRQNSSLHRWCEEVSDEMLNCGLGIDVFAQFPIEIPITKEVVKQVWRTIQKSMFGKESTADATSDQYSPVYEVFSKFLAERGVDIAWPCLPESEEFIKNK